MKAAIVPALLSCAIGCGRSREVAVPDREFNRGLWISGKKHLEIRMEMQRSVQGLFKLGDSRSRIEQTLGPPDYEVREKEAGTVHAKDYLPGETTAIGYFLSEGEVPESMEYFINGNGKLSHTRVGVGL